jgi:hypothetical protein
MLAALLLLLLATASVAQKSECETCNDLFYHVWCNGQCVDLSTDDCPVSQYDRSCCGDATSRSSCAFQGICNWCTDTNSCSKSCGSQPATVTVGTVVPGTVAPPYSPSRNPSQAPWTQAPAPASCGGLSRSQCSRSSGCKWDPFDDCVPIPTSCSQLTFSSCDFSGLGCKWSPTSNRCVTVTECTNVVTPGTCADQFGCVWCNSNSKCVDSSNFDLFTCVHDYASEAYDKVKRMWIIIGCSVAGGLFLLCVCTVGLIVWSNKRSRSPPVVYTTAVPTQVTQQGIRPQTAPSYGGVQQGAPPAGFGVPATPAPVVYQSPIPQVYVPPTSS